MAKPSKTLEEMVKELPPEERTEVREFVERVLARRRTERHGKPTFAWVGALKDLRDRYTSVELQHEISRLRTEGK